MNLLENITMRKIGCKIKKSHLRRALVKIAAENRDAAAAGMLGLSAGALGSKGLSAAMGAGEKGLEGNVKSIGELAASLGAWDPKNKLRHIDVPGKFMDVSNRSKEFLENRFLSRGVDASKAKELAARYADTPNTYLGKSRLSNVADVLMDKNKKFRTLRGLSAAGGTLGAIGGTLYSAYGDPEKSKYVPLVTGALAAPAAIGRISDLVKAHKYIGKNYVDGAAAKAAKAAKRALKGKMLGTAGLVGTAVGAPMLARYLAKRNHDK